MRLIDIEQNGPDWKKWRQKGIGASDATIIMGLSPWFSREQLLEKKVREAREAMGIVRSRPKGVGKDQPDNGAMARGRKLEPIARQLYIDLTGIESRPVCAIHDELDWMRASFDGLSGDGKIVLEIKCVNAFDHEAALEGTVPIKYVPQVQHQLYIAKTPTLHYFSYTDNPRFSNRDRAVLVTSTPSPGYQAKIVEAERAFWEEYQARLKDS